jgi:hypothetical protein
MRQWVAVLALVLGCVVPVEAAPVLELELDGTASNNSKATAQTIPTSAFTLPVPETVFNPPGFRTATLTGRAGGPDIDLFRISGRGQLLLDVDNEGDGIDSVLFLFNSSGVLLVVNDDATTTTFPDESTPNEDLGSLNSNNRDARIFFNLPEPGIYFVGITNFSNWGECEGPGPSCNTEEGWFVSNGPQPPTGFYLLHLSLEHPVPMPPTLALLVSVGLAAGTRFFVRRTRARS